MPYVEGESLRDRLNREHQLPLDDTLRLTREVVGALDYAQRHNVGNPRFERLLAVKGASGR